MANLSRQNVHDVLTHRPRDRVIVIKGDKGELERRIVKRPEGRAVEEFVDPAGHVVWIQLQQLGSPHGRDAIVAKRVELNVLGFVAYAKCPVRHGTRHATEKLEEEFASMPQALQAPCKEDPRIYERRGKHNYASEACPHIQWLVEDRRRRAAEEAELRASKIESAADIERQKLAISEQQLAEQRETTRRLLEVLEKVDGKRGNNKGDSNGR